MTKSQYSEYLYRYHLLHQGNKKQLPTQEEFETITRDIPESFSFTKSQWYDYFTLLFSALYDDVEIA